ncbi:MAG: dTDP-4-dehydrorhamnose 3,5-epimerase [Syntrophorhabdales bacterium]
MIFTEIKLGGAFVVEIEKLEDRRGFFGRTWCRREFEAHGLNPQLVQCSVSFNTSKCTLRGMHYQSAPYREAKLVRCTSGSLYDVVVDLRPESPTFMEYFGAVLESRDKRNTIYVPEGFAHGFLTLEEHTEVLYQMSEFYAPGAARGFRWNDPSFGIEWPEAPRVISDRDGEYPDFTAPGGPV